MDRAATVSKADGVDVERKPLEHTGAEYTYEQQRESADDQCFLSFHIYSPCLLMTYPCCSVGFTLTLHR
jgi:hypothetical protein